MQFATLPLAAAHALGSLRSLGPAPGRDRPGFGGRSPRRGAGGGLPRGPASSGAAGGPEDTDGGHGEFGWGAFWVKKNPKEFSNHKSFLYMFLLLKKWMNASYKIHHYSRNVPHIRMYMSFILRDTSATGLFERFWPFSCQVLRFVWPVMLTFLASTCLGQSLPWSLFQVSKLQRVRVKLSKIKFQTKSTQDQQAITKILDQVSDVWIKNKFKQCKPWFSNFSF